MSIDLVWWLGWGVLIGGLGGYALAERSLFKLPVERFLALREQYFRRDRR